MSDTQLHAHNKEEAQKLREFLQQGHPGEIIYSDVTSTFGDYSGSVALHLRTYVECDPYSVLEHDMHPISSRGLHLSFWIQCHDDVTRFRWAIAELLRRHAQPHTTFVNM